MLLDYYIILYDISLYNRHYQDNAIRRHSIVLRFYVIYIVRPFNTVYKYTSLTLIIKTNKSKIMNLFPTVVTFVILNNAIALCHIATCNRGIYNWEAIVEAAYTAIQIKKCNI